jgi:hypothetical protein
MIEPAPLLILGSTTVAGFGVVSAAALRGWNGWLALRRLEAATRPSGIDPSPPSSAARIDLADLRARVRRLEAIASGVEP